MADPAATRPRPQISDSDIVFSLLLAIPYFTGKLIVFLRYLNRALYGPPIHYQLSFLQHHRLKKIAREQGKVFISRTTLMVGGLVFWLVLGITAWSLKS